MSPDLSIGATLAEAKLRINAIDAEALLAHVLDKNRSYFRAWPEREIEPLQLDAYQQLCQRRQEGEPLAYIIGWREFWSLKLRVSPATLIPRPDTELLVEQALALIPKDADWRIADLGTGSGAIALAIASERPHCRVIATDICPEAMAVAQQNADALNLQNVEFRQGSWTEAFKQDEQFQLIASNPPYIDAADEHLQHDGLPFEPQGALSPGNDGLESIRIIIEQAGNHLVEPAWLLLEHGYDQGAAVRALLQQRGYDKTATLCDLGDNERMTYAQRTTGQRISG